MGENVSNVIWSYIFSNIFKSLYVSARLIWAPSPSEALVSLAAAVSEEQVRQAGDQKETHHHGPDDDGNDPLVIVGPTLHFWNRQTEKVSVLLVPLPLPTYYCMRAEQVQSICACLHRPSVASSHLSHTVLCPGWKPGSAEEPAWPAAATTSGADSQTCTWSSFRWLSWTSCRGPPNLNKSYLEGQGQQAATFSWFKQKRHKSARRKPSLFLLAHFLTGMGDRWAVSLVTKKTFFSWSKKWSS